MFPVATVNPQQAESLEQLGTKRKYWYAEGVRRLLFKAEERGTGEDWAEKLSCELAGLMGLPHVIYELAEEVGTMTPGVVCETCSPPPWSLVMGNQLLLARDPGYPADNEQKYKVRQHTVAAVADVLGHLQLPPQAWVAGLPPGIATATDVFVGYILLDAWVANQDRHHQNWAALRRDDELYLCPTFDHGASMARNLTDTERSERMATRDVNRQVAKFVLKARSAFYGGAADTKPLPTFEAWQEFARLSPSAAATWVAQLRMIEEDTVDGLLARVPPTRMSATCREFTRRLLNENRRRLLEAGGS
ncbi:MAG: phosphatidylinositol kinase [Gemmataceae bacterium]